MLLSTLLSDKQRYVCSEYSVVNFLVLTIEF